MKKILTLLVSVYSLTSAAGAATIALWTFESPGIPPAGSSNSFAGMLPEVGSGFASGFHANPTNVFSILAGNGSAQSLNANRWTPGDYWQFQVSTLGFTDIQLSFAQTANLVGATNFTLSYSLDGTAFSPVLSFYPVLIQSVAPWNTVTPNPASISSLDLSGISTLDNAPEVYFRLVSNLGTFAANAQGRIDDFQVTASVIPEPGNLFLAGLASLAFFGRRHRTKH